MKHNLRKHQILYKKVGSVSHVSDESIIENDDRPVGYLFVPTPNSRKGS